MQQEISKGAVLAAMRKELGKESAPGEWFVVDQTLINNFVDISGETGWLQVEPCDLRLHPLSAQVLTESGLGSHPLSRSTVG